jgi:hypothetical protein
MKSILLALIVVISLAACGSEDKSYTGEKTATHDCSKEPALSITTSNATLTFTSTCERVSINGDDNRIEATKAVAISGSKNVVEIGAADKISANGSDNTVYYAKALTGSTSNIYTTGNNNRVGDDQETRERAQSLGVQPK